MDGDLKVRDYLGLRELMPQDQSGVDSGACNQQGKEWVEEVYQKVGITSKAMLIQQFNI